MDATTSWLCPTPMHRERLLEMEAKLARPRALMYGALAIALVVAIPWMGIGPLAMLPIAVLAYRPLTSRVGTSARPEFWIAATVVNAQILLGIGIALSGGPLSPVIPILLLPLVTLPARFSSRGVYAGLAITIVILLATTVGIDPAGFAANPTFTIMGLAIAIGLTAFADVLMRVEMQQRNDAVLDPLTGLPNRKALEARFEALRDDSVCLLVCDLDHFKQINDVYGHDHGDLVLKQSADIMRAFGAAYRMGGEEFLLVLPGASRERGVITAERVRAAVEAGCEVTVSIGVAAASGDDVAFEPLFRAADRALYDAKRAGRNRVVGEALALAV